jgi:hypothetical protein
MSYLTKFRIPSLDLSMQATELVPPITKWGAIARTSKMAGTYHFYQEDYKFRALWKHPDQLVDSGCQVSLEMNFSTWGEMPRDDLMRGIYKKVAGEVLAVEGRADRRGFERRPGVPRRRVARRARRLGGVRGQAPGRHPALRDRGGPPAGMREGGEARSPILRLRRVEESPGHVRGAVMGLGAGAAPRGPR